MKENNRPAAKPVEIISAIESTIARETALNEEKGIGPFASDPELEPVKFCDENLTHDPQDFPPIDPSKQRLVVGPCPPCAAEKLRLYRLERV